MKRFSQNWLDIQARCIPGLRTALLLVSGESENELSPAAHWPAEKPAALELVAIARLAATQRGAVINPAIAGHGENAEKYDYLALPVYAADKLIAVVAITINHCDEETQRAALNSLTVGVNWLAAAGPEYEQGAAFYMNVVRLALDCLQQDTAQKSISALLSDLTAYYGCSRVSFGIVSRRRARIIAVSNTATADFKSNMSRSIATAMDEATSQAEIVSYPAAAAGQRLIVKAHAELAKRYDARSILSLPLTYAGEIFAVVTLECDSDRLAAEDVIAGCEQLLAIVAPYLYLKREDERFWLSKNIDNTFDGIAGLFGYQHLKTKLAVIALALATTYAAMTEVDFRVTADAVLEGRIQRIVAAPMDGFITQANVRAGDQVAAGNTLALMDDEEIKLERIKLNGRLEQLRRERRDSMANRKLVEMRLANTRIDQVKAELKLNQELLNRVDIRSPFDGIVVEGDLSQSLGAPVEKGDLLFKIAPLEGYRVILKVDERDISHVQPGQQGTLLLSSLPRRKITMTVAAITAVAQTEDGSNIFRVEATLLDTESLLRPGMEGIGKIAAGHESLLWIWTHELVDWFKLLVWGWWR